MPDDGSAEVEWVEHLSSSSSAAVPVQAIVASVDLASPNAEEDMLAIQRASKKVRGVRWILDCVGTFQSGLTATHVATSRHDGVDYLRGSNGGYDGTVMKRFEAGYQQLAAHGLSFDLQCAPCQLLQAAALAKRHPAVPVVIDHMGKPRTLLGEDIPCNNNTQPNVTELSTWRQGMRAMASLPHVYVKLSMLGYAIPGWIRCGQKEAVMRDLVRETVSLFGPQRCMIALNWYKNGAASDADGLSDVGPDPVTLVTKFSHWLQDYSEEDRNWMFYRTAKEFYRF